MGDEKEQEYFISFKMATVGHKRKIETVQEKPDRCDPHSIIKAEIAALHTVATQHFVDTRKLGVDRAFKTYAFRMINIIYLSIYGESDAEMCTTSCIHLGHILFPDSNVDGEVIELYDFIKDKTDADMTLTFIKNRTKLEELIESRFESIRYDTPTALKMIAQLRELVEDLNTDYMRFVNYSSIRVCTKIVPNRFNM